jgi:predicted phosphodiesterase
VQPGSADEPRRWWRRLLLALALVAVAVVGCGIGVAVAGGTDARIGPVDTHLQVGPALSGGARVRIPPLGTISFATHRGPLHLNASVEQVRPEVARSLARDPDGVATLGTRVGTDLHAALVRLAVRTAVAGVAGALLLGLLAFRSWRRGLLCALLCTGGLTLAGGVAAATWSKASVREPRYTGLLVSAPTALGDAETIVANFAQYRRALGQLVGNVVELYDVTSTLPTYRPDGSTIAVLHVSDLHLNPAGIDLVTSLVEPFRVRAVVDSGDLTDHGTAAESAFVSELRRIQVPYVFIRGNHDSVTTEAQVRAVPGATVLDGDVADVAGLRIAGIGDPRFTPDKTTRSGDTDDLVVSSGEQLAGLLDREQQPVDIALVHDPVAAAPLMGKARLLLAGHRHHREQKQDDGTLLLVEGSTGGAGLRGLEGEKPTPLECSILYFDAESHQLQAWDDVTLGGLGATSVTIERHLPSKDAPPESSPTPTPTPSGG